MKGSLPMAKHDDDNRANQMNPNNDAYWESRGYEERPDEWEDHHDEVVDFNSQPLKSPQ